MAAEMHPGIDVKKKGVELDVNGFPYHKWPPFPDPPDNIKIIPFNEFKPSGIQISFDDEVEVDGLGIPTVRLPVIHDNEAPPRKKKKTKLTAAGEEIRQRSNWWEEWEEGEEQRLRSIGTYDRTLHVKDRIAQAVADFKSVHDWQSTSLRLLDWYKKLEVYLGLHEPNLRPRFARKQDQDQELEDEGDDDDDAASGNQKPSPLTVEKFDEEKHRLRQDNIPNLTAEQEEKFRLKLARVREALEIRLDAFIDNPCLATKVFFCSYFRDSGMMWEKMALRDAPRIYEFFLKFLLRTRALFEEEPRLKQALEVVRKAKEELPLTMQIGHSMPDELAQCMVAIYGSKTKGFSWGNESDVAAAEGGFKTEVEESGGTIISDLAPGPSTDPGKNDAVTEVEAAKLPHPEEATGGWSSIGVDAGNWGASASNSGKFEIDSNEDDPWAQNTKPFDAWGEPDIHFLMALLGPTTLPLTHAVGYVEESTRYIASVTLPETNGDQDQAISTSTNIFRSFARVVLNPYSSFPAPSVSRASIQPPELIEDPWSGISATSSAKPNIPRHDPGKDPITLLVQPELGKLLASAKNMGLGGTFVQIAPDYSRTVPIQPDDEHARGLQIIEESVFWYAEKILRVLPSFWTERQI
ncbi:hypothetical protein ACEPAF_6193 [Sanghuangporus sanghuang]